MEVAAAGAPRAAAGRLRSGLRGREGGEPRERLVEHVCGRPSGLDHRAADVRPAANDVDELVFRSANGAAWREHDYRNWRRRIFRPLAPSCGLSTRPYDLRHSFASMRIQEDRLSIVELAEQLGTARR